MTPQLHSVDASLGQIRLLFEVEPHHAGANIGAADIHGEDRIVALNHPRWQQVGGTNKACFVRMVVKQFDCHIDFGLSKENAASRDGKLANATCPKAAAEHNALGIPPGFLAQEPLDDM